MPALVTRPTYPRAPYPEDVPTHPLLIVDYLAVEAGDEAAIDVLFKACSTLGFFYLANTELDAEPIFAVSSARIRSRDKSPSTDYSLIAGRRRHFRPASGLPRLV